MAQSGWSSDRRRVYQRLRETLPDVSLFEKRFDAQRKYGQKSHDRYTLEWRTDPPVPRPWKEFIAELEGTGLSDFLGESPRDLRLLVKFSLALHPENGCSVSPHCDAKPQARVSVFSTSTLKDDWDPSWEGQRLSWMIMGAFTRLGAEL